MSDVVISGYYGFRNNGDDALLKSIILDLRSIKPDIDIVVLSKHPKETSKIYGVRAVDREDIFCLVKEIARTKMLISGGGTLIQDATSTKSLLYYLFVIKLAQLFKKKVMLYANGIGPLKRPNNIKIAASVLNKVNLITLRDEASKEELEKIGVTAPDIVVSADPVFGIKPISDEILIDAILDGYGVDNNSPLLCVSVRPWAENSEEFCDAIAEACDYAAEKYNMFTVFLPMQPKRDTEITRKIKEKMKSRSCVVNSSYEISRLLGIISEVNICIGMRLHTLIYAAVSAVPLIGLVYDPKVSGFMDYIGQKNYSDVSELDADSLIRHIDNVMTDYDGIRSDLKEKSKLLSERAYESAKLAIELLEGE